MNAVPVLVPSKRGKNQEARVGLFVIIGIVAVIFLLFAFTQPALFRGRYTVFAIASDAQGLRRGDPVRMRGVNIGRVTGFELGGAAPGVKIRLEVEKQYPIPADSRAQIASANLLGESVVEVVPGHSSQRLESGQQMEGEVGPNAMGRVNELTKQAREALARVQGLLSDRTLEEFRSSSSELNRAIKELALMVSEQRQTVGGLTDSLRKSAVRIEKFTSSQRLERSVDRLDSMITQLDGAASSLARSSNLAESVLARIDNGEGSIGMLTKDGSLFSNANETLSSLNKAASEITKLAAEIRKDPGRFVKFSVF